MQKNTEYSAYFRMLCACYRDIASAYPALNEVECSRDLTTLVVRFENEGLGFLTKTLPSLAKAIDKALASGTALQAPSFSRKKGSKLPKFIGWLIGRVFSTEGRELEESDPRALMHIRQLLYLFYKLEMPYDDNVVSSFLDEFITTDADLVKGWHISEPTHRSEIRYASKLIRRVLAGCSARDIIPGHGPGSVATGEKAYDKPYFKRDYPQLNDIYPLDEYFYMNANHQSERLNTEGLTTLCPTLGTLRPWEVFGHSTAKVVLVPKDSRGPRLISMEPLEIQWIQQGQCERIVTRLESHWLTKGHVNFADQGINRYLAHVASCPDGLLPKSWGPVKVDHSGQVGMLVPNPQGLVTIDMKEASDRVSLLHIYHLFPENWIEALEATRSSETMLPDGRQVSLNKFAPMGSAVCFPVEAIVFWALALSAIMHRTPMPLSQLRERVWVYGDDIICYREDYPVVKQSLERTGLLLNADKCCTSRFFKESCGLDAYKGIVVTPLRIKQRVSRHWHGQETMAYVAYSNAAHDRGYDELALEIEKILSEGGVKVPYSTVDFGAVQFVRPYANVRSLNKLHQIRTRFCKRTHRLMAYGPTPRAVISSGHPTTYETYFARSVSRLRENPFDAPLKMESALNPTQSQLRPDQYSVPRRVTSKRGWTQIAL